MISPDYYMNRKELVYFANFSLLEGKNSNQIIRYHHETDLMESIHSLLELHRQNNLRLNHFDRVSSWVIILRTTQTLLPSGPPDSIM